MALSTTTPTLRFLLLLMVGGWLGCGDDEGNGAILGAGHAGWGKAQCSTCHKLPIEGHSASQPFECAACHGGNGACDPDKSGTAHTPGSDCLSCHATQHAFPRTTPCRSCHWAEHGVVKCGN